MRFQKLLSMAQMVFWFNVSKVKKYMFISPAPSKEGLAAAPFSSFSPQPSPDRAWQFCEWSACCLCPCLCPGWSLCLSSLPSVFFLQGSQRHLPQEVFLFAQGTDKQRLTAAFIITLITHFSLTMYACSWCLINVGSNLHWYFSCWFFS